MTRRFRGVEWLDDPDVDKETRLVAMRDLVRANTYLGGARIVLAELWRALGPAPPNVVSVLDVGTGAGDILRRARTDARKRRVRLETLGLDRCPTLADAATAAGTPTLSGDARALPFPDRSFDVVLCSQLLHHFGDDEAIQVLRELDRVARQRVIVCDLRRSWLAAAGFWVASLPLGFHRVSRHDGFVSVLRGFSAAELSALVSKAVGHAPHVRQRLGFRLTASWAPACIEPRIRDRPRPLANAAAARRGITARRALATVREQPTASLEPSDRVAE